MRVASDVGGTFTDLVYYETDLESGRRHVVRTAKVDTTPPHFEEGVLNSLTKADIDARDFDFFAHGSTVIINAITERKGVKTALITTRGFRDVLEIARGNRPDLFNFRFRKPKPFVERHLRLELDERISYKGEIQREVDLAPLPDLLEYLKAEGAEAIAVSFLHAYINPENEIKTVNRIRELWPEVSVLASHQISREWREYERTNTAVLSAYVHPIAKQYIESLEGKLKDNGFSGKLYMMQSNCGIATVTAAKENPISMVESGPASGIFAAAYLGNTIGRKNLIVLDIGGTTAKCTLIHDGNVRITTDYYVEKSRTNPGYPIQSAVSEIVEIGNGGGSIAWVDEGGKLRVGPQSAGAVPGPACYGRGGAMPTTTDANLLLGRIDKNCFAGGEIQPDFDAVGRAFDPVAKKLRVTHQELARGIIRIANSNMTNALRLVSTNRGYDPRDFALMAFGGGGAMHAVALAEELKIPRVIVPVNSAVFSAWGMLLTDLRRDYVRTSPMSLDSGNESRISELFAATRQQAEDDYRHDGIDLEKQPVVFEHYADMRYVGQEHTVKIAFPMDEHYRARTDRASMIFHEAHERRYTYRLDAAVQIVNFHVVAKILVDKPPIVEKPSTGIGLEQTILHAREVDFGRRGVHEATICDGTRMESGMRLMGPAVIQEASMTLVVSPGHELEVDEYGNYHVILKQGG